MAILPNASYEIKPVDLTTDGFTFEVASDTLVAGEYVWRAQGEDGVFLADYNNAPFESGKTYLFRGSHPEHMPDAQLLRVVFDEFGVSRALDPKEDIGSGTGSGSISAIGGVPLNVANLAVGEILRVAALPNGTKYFTNVALPVPNLQAVTEAGNTSDRDVAFRTLTVDEFPDVYEVRRPAVYQLINGKLVLAKTSWSRLLEYLAVASDDGVIATLRTRLAITGDQITNGVERVYFLGKSLTIDAPFIQSAGVMLARTFRRLVTSPATKPPALFLVAELRDEDGTYDDKTVSPAVMWQALKPYAIADLSAVDIPGDSRVAEAVFCLPRAEAAPTFYRKAISSGMVGVPQTHNLNKPGTALFPTLLGPDNKSALDYMTLTFPTNSTYLIQYGEGVTTGFTGKLELIPID